VSEVASAQVIQNFQAALYSLAEPTSPFPLRRTVAVSLYVTADSEHADDQAFEVVESFRARVAEILASRGYSLLADQWGPFWGSGFITLFGRGEHEELGGSFRDHLADMTRDLSQWIKGMPPGLKITVAVGSAVIGSGLLGTISPMALCLVALAPNADTVLDEMEKLFRGGSRAGPRT
jgi:hypothetical protein